MKRGDDCSWSRIVFFFSFSGFFCLVASFVSPRGDVRGLRNDSKWPRLCEFKNAPPDDDVDQFRGSLSSSFKNIIEHIISFGFDSYVLFFRGRAQPQINFWNMLSTRIVPVHEDLDTSPINIFGWLTRQNVIINVPIDKLPTTSRWSLKTCHHS